MRRRHEQTHRADSAVGEQRYATIRNKSMPPMREDPRGGRQPDL